MSPKLQQEVNAFFEKQAGIDPRRIAMLRRMLQSPRALGAVGAVGAAGGAAGMYGLRELGQQRLQAQREAQELRQLLELNPELLNAPLYSGDPYAMSTQPQGPYGGGYGY